MMHPWYARCKGSVSHCWRSPRSRIVQKDGGVADSAFLHRRIGVKLNVVFKARAGVTIPGQPRTLGSVSCDLSYNTVIWRAMETTLTIRLPKKQRDALIRRARAEGRSASALVRDLLEREVHRGFDFERVRHLVGSVCIDRKKIRGDAWAEHIRRSNWRK